MFKSRATHRTRMQASAAPLSIKNHISPPPFQRCSKNKADDKCCKFQCLRQVHSLIQPFAGRFISQAAFHDPSHFFISFIPPASAPRSKSPAFAPLHKSLPISFRALVIYLSNSFQNCISILYINPTLVNCFPAFPANSSKPSIPSIRFVPFHKVIAFPFPHHTISQMLYFPCRIVHPGNCL